MGGNGGLVDIFRRIQVTACNIAQAHAPLTVVLRGLPARVRAQDPCSIQVWALNERGPQHNLTLLWEQRARDGRTVARGGWPLTLAGTERQEYLGQIDLRTDSFCGRGLAAPSSRAEAWFARPGHRGGPFLDFRRSAALAFRRSHPRHQRPLGPLASDRCGGMGSLFERGSCHALVAGELGFGRRIGTSSAMPTSGPKRRASLWPYCCPRRVRGVAKSCPPWPDCSQGQPLSLLPLRKRLGGWVYSHAHPLLAGVADPGIWGHPQADLFPSHVVRRLPGNTLVGGCAFAGDQAPLPHLGTALGIIPWGASELLFCVLPVVSGCQKHLLSAEHLMHNIARWLVRKD